MQYAIKHLYQHGCPYEQTEYFMKQALDIPPFVSDHTTTDHTTTDHTTTDHTTTDHTTTDHTTGKAL